MNQLAILSPCLTAAASSIYGQPADTFGLRLPTGQTSARMNSGKTVVGQTRAWQVAKLSSQGCGKITGHFTPRNGYVFSTPQRTQR
jgi:hypothetical protein